MKFRKKQSGVILTAFLLLVVLCTLAFAACGITEPAGGNGTDANTDANTDAGTDAPVTTAEIPSTTATPIVSEPEVGEGAAPVRTADGAAVSFVPTGLRFTGLVEKSYLDALNTAYGEENVTVGMLVSPTSALQNGTIDPAAEATVRIPSGSIEADGDDYRFFCVFPFSEEIDYTRKYSAVAFVEVCGTILRCAEYAADRNAVMPSVVADAALNDLSDTQDETHKYAVEVDGKTVYGSYSKRQRDLLADYLVSCSFTVMSYNIEVYDSSAGWEGRNPLKAIETVKEKQPDIVGFQEADAAWDSMLNSLAQTCGYTRLTGEFTKYNFERNEILFKTDKFTLITKGTRSFKQMANELSITNDENADLSLDKLNRVFHFVVLQEKESGRKILVVNTHLHYGGTGTGHEEDDKVRRYEIRTLLAWMSRQAATYPDQIVMGDMNASYSSGQGKVTMNLYLDGGMSFALNSALVKGEVSGTLATSNRSVHDKWVFDYIMSRGSLGTSYYTVVDNPIDNGNYPSDHIPVLAKIYLK